MCMWEGGGGQKVEGWAVQQGIVDNKYPHVALLIRHMCIRGTTTPEKHFPHCPGPLLLKTLGPPGSPAAALLLLRVLSPAPLGCRSAAVGCWPPSSRTTRTHWAGAAAGRSSAGRAK